MHYCVYVLLCCDGSFYTGYTRDLEARIRLHKNGRGARYTKTHKPKRLVYVEEFATISEAMKKERKVKKLSHRQKLELIKANRHVKKTRTTARRQA